MDSKQTSTTGEIASPLLNNEEYFKYIFKKTEKIVATVFYVTRSLREEIQKDSLVLSLESKSLRLLDTCERTLALRGKEQSALLVDLRVALISLESALSLLRAGHIIEGEIFSVFQNECNTLHRTIASYVPRASLHEMFTLMERGGGVGARVPRARTQSDEVRAPRSPILVPSLGLPSRTERIKAIIKEKGQVTIKDISLAITDVSEKTIQRELMSLISQGLLVKEGERRWSKYSLA